MSEQEGKAPISPNILYQFRQLSIPLWARGVVLFLVSAVFFADLVFLGFGFWNSNEKWLVTAAQLFGVTFVPTLAVVYLAFAETGVVALKRKTTELLNTILPSSLRAMGDVLGVGTLQVESIAANHESPSRRYRLRFNNPDDPTCKTIELLFSLDVNVHKANLGVWVPVVRVEGNATAILECLRHTLEGARREGYELNDHPAKVIADGLEYFVLVLIKRLPQDFLWDPGQKLYFAQDLRFFLASAMREGESYFCREVS